LPLGVSAIPAAPNLLEGFKSTSEETKEVDREDEAEEEEGEDDDNDEDRDRVEIVVEDNDSLWVSTAVDAAEVEAACSAWPAADALCWSGPSSRRDCIFFRFLLSASGCSIRIMEPKRMYKRERLVPKPSRVSSLTRESPSDVSE